MSLTGFDKNVDRLVGQVYEVESDEMGQRHREQIQEGKNIVIDR